jgi:DNA-binding NarL/FixJ family response regulator
MRILLATEQPELRIALVLYLSEEPGMTVIGTASEAASLRALLMTARPELVLLDWALPGHPPASLVAEAKSLDPHSQVIVLGKDLDVKQAALAAGADAFVLKGDPPGLLLAAIRQARSERVALTVLEPIAAKGE